MKNSHGGVTPLVELEASDYSFTKSNIPPWVFPRFLTCTNDTKRAMDWFLYDNGLCHERVN